MSFQTNVLSQFEKKAQFEAELQRYEEQADFLFRKQRLERIENFTDQYEFLANEYPCAVYYEVPCRLYNIKKGLIYHSVYAAFQAARSDEEEVRQRIASSNSVLEVFQIAQHIEDPKEWSKSRLRVMEILLRDKFRRNNELRDRLRESNNYQLLNTTNQPSASNLFWGVVDGKGQNQLGRIIEDIRQDVHNNEDLDKWLLMSFKIEKDKNLIPLIKLLVEKDDEHIETITLIEKSYYQFGQYQKNDVFLAHPSVSRKQCVLFISHDYSIQVVDLGSRSGTFINDQVIEPHLPYGLANDDKLKFAKSTRIYTIDIIYSECKEYLQRRIKQTEQKVHLLDKVQQGMASHEELKASLGLVIEDTVMVQNLPEKVSHFELKQLFSKKGKITELKIPIDRSTGNTKNVAFIKYENEKDAKWFVDNERLNYKGNRLRLSLASNDRVETFYEELRWGDKVETKVEGAVPKDTRSRSRSSSRRNQKKHHHHSKHDKHRDKDHKNKKEKRRHDK